MIGSGVDGDVLRLNYDNIAEATRNLLRLLNYPRNTRSAVEPRSAPTTVFRYKSTHLVVVVDRQLQGLITYCLNSSLDHVLRSAAHNSQTNL